MENGSRRWRSDRCRHLRRVWLRVGLVVAGTAVAASSLHAQGAPSRATPSVGRSLAGALVGGAAGVLVGGIAGGYIGGNRCTIEGNPDSCRAIGGAIVGGYVGYGLGVPVGAHLLDRRRGKLGWSLAASAALAAVGVSALVAAEERDGDPARRGERDRYAAIAFAVPVLQVLSAVAIETGTGR
jgi:hypothetical protein